MERSTCLVSALLVACLPAHAFESDFHFGLTQWLAGKAGFSTEDALLIAEADQRRDSGTWDAIDVVFHYACIGHEETASKDVQIHHFPGDGRVPGDATKRAVTAGSEAAFRDAKNLIANPVTDHDKRLELLGYALHALQDSWSHQGIPDIPGIGPIRCDKTLAWAHPRERGGWYSHQADLTYAWEKDSVDAAHASYDMLRQLTTGKPADWSQVELSLVGFIKARTKAEKKKWFIGQGITDVSFLNGISLPDGDEVFASARPRNKLQIRAADSSAQKDVPSEVLVFYNQFFHGWVKSSDPAKSMRGFTNPDLDAKARELQRQASDEVVGRLVLLKARDHGAVAGLLHSPRVKPSKMAEQIVDKGGGAIKYESLSDAVIPLSKEGQPFLIKEMPKSVSGNPQAIAFIRLRNAPYDTIAVVAEKISGKWFVVRVVEAIDD